MIVTSILYSVIVGFSMAFGGNVINNYCSSNCFENTVENDDNINENKDENSELSIKETIDSKGYITLNDLVQIEKKKSDDSIDSNKYNIYPIKEISSPVQEKSLKKEKMSTQKKETSVLFTPFLGFRADRATLYH